MSKPRQTREYLTYSLEKVSQGTIRREYAKWRTEQGLPYRCDNATCSFHDSKLIWDGKPISMILDHIDGNRRNNRTDNLRFLCPNCDSQLPTRGGKNRGRIQKGTTDSYHIVEPDGRNEVKAFLTGVQATAMTGTVGAKK
ncbi:HNH endonuclease [Burkholderia stagnalis]|uniref:HNH endonuclease n=1 Tax=Burkholderia stagnalis TaxID=1503054 RepID=UPI0009C06B5E